MRRSIFIIVLLFICSSPAQAEINNRAALENLQTVKAVFDINQGNPGILKLRLQLIEMSYQQLKKARVQPDFVLTFRGKASFFLTAGMKHIAIEDRDVQKEIHALLEMFSNRDIPLEQCAITADLAGIDNEDFIPQVDVVTNGYISLMAYQNKGYALIPME
ncbi:MAG: DsrE family protein [Desulfuromonadales bacterium]|nr:DsrE family protein [Desulfuromonadales bacterium]MBN2792626.1 DsrE family protein [Desulfuromonadales bacterium]